MAMVELILDFVLVVNYKGRYHTTTTYNTTYNAVKGGEGQEREKSSHGREKL